MKAKNILATFTILILVMLLAACGTSTNEEPDADNGASEGIIKEEVTSVLEQMDSNLYRYSVNNHTDKPMTFNFTSGQRFDYTISNEKSAELYRDSSVSMYTQALAEERLEPGGTLEYEFEVPPLELEAGVYTIKAWLTPEEGAQYEAEIEHTVE